MTVDQWVEKSGRAFKRARELETHLTELAQVALAVGFHREAQSLMAIAARAMPCAELFVETLTERCMAGDA